MKKLILAFYIISIVSVFSSETTRRNHSNLKNLIYTEVFTKHILNINHLEKENNAIIILFSGTPGMGKTTISKILEENLSGIRICSDEVRRIFLDMHLDPGEIPKDNNLNNIEEYLIYLFHVLDNTSKNHLFILDMSCDRSYNSMKHLAEIYNYPLFVIRLQLPYEETKNRITLREKNPEKYLKFFDVWYNDYKNFDESKWDYLLNVDCKTDELPISDLIDQINNKATLFSQQKN